VASFVPTFRAAGAPTVLAPFAKDAASHAVLNRGMPVRPPGPPLQESFGPSRNIRRQPAVTAFDGRASKPVSSREKKKARPFWSSVCGRPIGTSRTSGRGCDHGGRVGGTASGFLGFYEKLNLKITPSLPCLVTSKQKPVGCRCDESCIFGWFRRMGRRSADLTD